MPKCYPPGSKIEFDGCEHEEGDVLIGSAYDLAIIRRARKDRPVAVERWQDIKVIDARPLDTDHPEDDPQVGWLGMEVDEVFYLADAVRALCNYFPAQGKRSTDDAEARKLYLRLAYELKEKCESVWPPRPPLIASR